MNNQIIFAIFRRNFFSYFSSPNGYVFICVFVLLSTFAAFWNNTFFATNLANLDQLTPLFPFVMLVFIPAITMSVWADERHLGTDELILTLPARDVDVVVGKYLASLAIYTAALLFSAVCNLCVLKWLGSPDVGLFISTYAGYWLIGVAMLAIGMTASFLTANQTIAYILGALLNAPLIFAVYADTIMDSQVAQAVKYWSFTSRFEPFGRGLLSLGSVLYFAAIAVTMLYVCMVLIGRRHWFTGKSGSALTVHYTLRIVSLAAIVAGVTVLANRADVQVDMTSEGLNSLHPDTIKLLRELKSEHPVQIHAYVSPQVPEEYVQTKYNLEAMLGQIQKYSGGSIQVRLHYLERFTEEALQAEKDFGILAQQVDVESRGNLEKAYVYLGVAMTSGLNRDVTPFLSRGLSVEYELLRSLLSVTAQKRKRIGVLATDARMFGGLNRATMNVDRKSALVAELERLYDVVEVNAAEMIAVDSLDALLAVQPSTLPPAEMTNFILAVQAGLPTAIFEDPAPVYLDVTPYGERRRSPREVRNPMMGMGTLPQGKIDPLWSTLGISFPPKVVVAQEYSPIPRLGTLPAPFLIIDNQAAKNDEKGVKLTGFSAKNPVTKGMRQVLIPYGGYFTQVTKEPSDAYRFTPLLTAGTNSGVMKTEDLLRLPMFGFIWENLKRGVTLDMTHLRYTVAAEIVKKGQALDQKHDVHVILTADTDLLYDVFFQFREHALSPDVDFDNVSFVLNAVDRVAKENRFYAIRLHRPLHRKLEAIDRITREAQKDAVAQQKKLDDEINKMIDNGKKMIDEEMQRMRQRLKDGGISEADAAIQLNLFFEDRTKRLVVEQMKAQQDRDREEQLLKTQLQTKINRAQNQCKLLAVVLPPILPLLVAVFVFFRRQWKQREGVSRARLR